MKKIFVLILVLIGAYSYAQQDSIAMIYADRITANDLENHLKVIASDEYEGRETGEKGQKMAAEYISTYFKKLGILPVVDGSYYQEFPLKKESALKSTIVCDGQTFKFIDDFFYWSGFESQEIKDQNLVFAGYGIKTDSYNDYEGIDVKGKYVVMYEGEPLDSEGNSLVSKEKGLSQWSGDWKIKRELAEEKGALGILMIKKDYVSYLSRVKYWLENPSLRLDYDHQRGEDIIPVLFITEKLANTMFNKKKLDKWMSGKKGKKALISESTTINIVKEKESITSENVLCYIEGSDPKLKDELVVITAHYDHVGVTDGEVYNGADDDGSGTVSALELAEAFVKAKEDGNGTRRSVLVMTVSGEEKGLLGSEWYSEYPIFPLENTVCNLNIDMIGRVDDAHIDNENYIYLIGSDKLSTDLHKISESANSTYTDLELDYTYNHPDDPNRFYYRSDHYNFAKHGIPVIFYFSGVHDDYHQPGDDVEKIMFDKMETIVKLVFHTAWEVANRDEKLEVDVVNEFTD